MREEVTYAYCQPSLDALFAACKQFIDDAKRTGQRHDRSSVARAFELDPEEEKLRVSA